MHYIRSIPVTMTIVLLVPVALELSLVAAFYEGAYKQIKLANEEHLRKYCPPKLMSVYHNSEFALHVLCALRCAANSDCSFFSDSGSQCALWTFRLDSSYDMASFSAPTTVAYWPKKNVPSSAQDVAIGKPVRSGTVANYFSSASVLTYGTSCNSYDVVCYGSQGNEGWVVVDLLTSLPVTKIIVTAPPKTLDYFFSNITIRAGNTGEEKQDTVVGVTPTTATDQEAFEYNVTGNIRYIRLQNEENDRSIVVCKVQAFL